MRALGTDGQGDIAPLEFTPFQRNRFRIGLHSARHVVKTRIDDQNATARMRRDSQFTFADGQPTRVQSAAANVDRARRANDLDAFHAM